MKKKIEVPCHDDIHHVELVDDGDEMILRFPDHENIEKEATVATIRGIHKGCAGIFLEATGGIGHKLTRTLWKYLHQSDNDAVRMLLAAGADPEYRDENNWGAIDIVTLEDDVEKFDILVEYGLDPVGLDIHESTPLHTAASNISPDIVSRLIELGADVNARMFYGDTPLMGVYDWEHLRRGQEGALDVVKILVGEGADVNAANDSGVTPLHMIAGSGAYAIVEFLLERGADPEAKNSLGDTPADYASRDGHHEIADLIVMHARARRRKREKEDSHNKALLEAIFGSGK